MVAGTRRSGEAEMGLGDGGTSGDDDGGGGTGSADADWPEWHALEDGSEMSGTSDKASAKGGLAQSCRITFDKGNPVGFALRGAAAKESEPFRSEPGSDLLA